MVMETAAASFVLVCLGFFFSINLHNVLVVHRSSRAVRSYAEVDGPSGLALASAIPGTRADFVQAISYPILVLTSPISTLSAFDFRFSNTAHVCGLFGHDPRGEAPRETSRSAILRISQKSWPFSPEPRQVRWKEAR